MEIIFIKVFNDSGHPYDWSYGIPAGSHSYTDYHALIRLSGFKTCELGEVDFDSENYYIFAPKNGYTDAALNRPHRCKIIHWSLERPGTEDCAYVDETWVSDRYQHRLANNPRFRYVPMGGHPSLGGDRKLPILWDLAFFSYMVGEREAKIHRLFEKGLLIAPNGYGEAREYGLAHSRFGLCLHQTPHPIIEPLRYTLFACWRLPLICEWSEDFWPYNVLPFEPDLKTVLEMDQGFVEDTARANYVTLTERLTFRNCVEQAVFDPNKEF